MSSKSESESVRNFPESIKWLIDQKSYAKPAWLYCGARFKSSPTPSQSLVSLLSGFWSTNRIFLSELIHTSLGTPCLLASTVILTLTAFDHLLLQFTFIESRINLPKFNHAVLIKWSWLVRIITLKDANLHFIQPCPHQRELKCLKFYFQLQKIVMRNLQNPNPICDTFKICIYISIEKNSIQPATSSQFAVPIQS